jgi:hypothetical protein
MVVGKSFIAAGNARRDIGKYIVDHACSGF